MKTINYLMLAAVAAAAMSCGKEVLPEPEFPTSNAEFIPITFKASSDDGEDTKVFYDGLTKSTQWKEGDKIMVISSTGVATEFEATSVSEDGKEAMFEGLNVQADGYYAVSPASAYNGNGNVKVKENGEEVEKWALFVEIPQIQKAVAGTFDPDAFVSIAKNDGENLQFKNSCSVIKFRLNNVEGVKSVRFTANNVTNLAGNQCVITTNIPNHSWGGPFEGRTSYNILTLNAPKEGFVAETDYYMTVRPQTMASGINVYLEYASGVKVRKGDSSFPATRNMIRDLKIIDDKGVVLSDVAPYDAYTLGFDINAAGTKINKDTHPNAKLIESTATIGNGVSFINSNATATLGSNLSNCIIIGNSTDKRGTITIKDYSQLTATTNDSEKFVISNMVINTTSNTKTYVLVIGGSGNFEEIAFENCEINHPKGIQEFIYCANRSDNRYISNFTMNDCELHLTEPPTENRTTYILVNNNALAGNPAEPILMNTVYFRNNVFSSETCADFRLFNNSNIKFENFTLERNSFINIYNANGTSSDVGYIYGSEFKNVRLYANLFQLSDYEKKTSNKYTAIFNCSTVPSDVTNQYNYVYYGSTTPTGRLKAWSGSTNITSPSVYGTMVYSNENIVKRDFTNKGNYGATR